MATFEALGASGRGVAKSALVLIVAPAATHAALIASWWLLFKWLPGVPGLWTVALAAWALLLPLAALALATGIGRRVPRVDLAARAPGAIFFFVLLALTAKGQLELIAYALAFALPYLALLAPPVPAAT